MLQKLYSKIANGSKYYIAIFNNVVLDVNFQPFQRICLIDAHDDANRVTQLSYMVKIKKYILLTA